VSSKKSEKLFAQRRSVSNIYNLHNNQRARENEIGYTRLQGINLSSDWLGHTIPSNTQTTGNKPDSMVSAHYLTRQAVWAK